MFLRRERRVRTSKNSFGSDHHHNLLPNVTMDTTNFNLQEVESRRLQLTQSQSSSRRLSTAAGYDVVRSRDHDLAWNHDRPRSVGSQSHHHRPKASNFPFTSISIGPNWRRVSRREGDLTAKLYFAKRKLIWEFLEGELKSKIEVQWSDITAIHALMPPNQPGTLQIELDKTPSFFREIKPQPRKHTNWEHASDFTDGHALLHRIHYVIFPHGELDKHYPKLLQCDQNLFELSQKPFPSQGESPYFDTSFNNPTISPSLNPIAITTAVVSSDDHQPLLLRDHVGMANHHNSFHEVSFFNSTASGSGQQHLRVLPSHHLSYNQELDFNGGGPCSSEFNQIQNNPNLYGVTHDGGPFSSQFNQIQNNPNLYGVTHVDQEMMQIIAAHDSNNNNAAAPINWLPPPSVEGSNFYGGLTVEQQPELINNNNFAINWLPPPILEESNFYGGVTVEQRPELINNINFANWLPPPTLEESNFYGGMAVEQWPELINNNNLGNDGLGSDGVTSVDLYNHLPFNQYRPPYTYHRG